MERIGIAASKIAKGNLLLYNFFVILLIFLISLLIFLVAGSFIVIILIVIAYAISAGSGTLPDLQQGWIPIMIVCLKVLAVITGLLALCALGINIRFRKHE